jgi:hypothetical protein
MAEPDGLSAIRNPDRDMRIGNEKSALRQQSVGHR